MVGADALGGQFQGSAFGLQHAGAMLVDFGTRKRQPAGGQFQPVKTRGQLAQGGIAAGANVGDDRGDRIIDIGRIFALGREKGCETRLEIIVERGKELGHVVSPVALT